MSKIPQTADTIWRIITHQSIDQNNFYRNLKNLDHVKVKWPWDQKELMERYIRMMRSQPTTADLVRRWELKFEQQGKLSTSDAKQFIYEFYESLEDVKELFPTGFKFGSTTAKIHHLSDIQTRRPFRKNGWSLNLTVEGSGLYNCIRQQLVTRPGGLVLYSPDAIYDYRRADNAQIWGHQWLCFPHEERWMRWLRWPEVGPGIYHINTDGVDYKKLRSLFSEVNAIYPNKEAFDTELLENILEQILIRCTRLQPGIHTNNIDERVKYAMQYIAKNYNQNFMLQDISTQVALSSPRLALLFKQQVGVSIMRWRDEKRLSKACELLIGTSQSIAKISEFLGYSDPLYFSRIFRKYMNISPREYRSSRLPQ